MLLEEEPERSIQADYAGESAQEQDLQNGRDFSRNGRRALLKSHSHCLWPVGPYRTAEGRPGRGKPRRIRPNQPRSLERKRCLETGTRLFLLSYLLCVSVMSIIAGQLCSVTNCGYAALLNSALTPFRAQRNLQICIVNIAPSAF